MVIAAHRAYSDAIRWIKAAQPRRVEGWRFARRAFGGSFAAGCGVLGVIALLAPSRFGEVGTTTFRTGWPALALVAVIVVVLLLALSRRSRISSLIRRIREPFSRPLSEHPSFEGAAGALSACPSALKTRFAVGRVWGPVALGVVGATCAFSTAYFFIDAILALGAVGWIQPLYAGFFVVLGLMTFRIAAPRLATWRLAASVYKDATTGYL